MGGRRAPAVAPLVVASRCSWTRFVSTRADAGRWKFTIPLGAAESLPFGGRRNVFVEQPAILDKAKVKADDIFDTMASHKNFSHQTYIPIANIQGQLLILVNSVEWLVS